MPEIINISAADLCKRSASQMWFLRRHPAKRGVTENQIEGTRQQELNTKSDYREMRGTYKIGAYAIHFCVDEVIPVAKKLECIEHKWISNQDEAPEWHFKMSLVQSACYHALLKNVPRLETASFYVFKGHTKRHLGVNCHVDYYLKYGEKDFKVECVDDWQLLRFLVAKTKASMTYDNALSFDKVYKHKEFDILSKFFEYVEID